MMFILPLHKCYRRDDRQDYHRHSFLQFHRTANTLTDVHQLTPLTSIHCIIVYMWSYTRTLPQVLAKANKHRQTEGGTAINLW